MLKTPTVVKAEMVDRFVDYDGMSVQVDLEELETGERRYSNYVWFSDDTDEWPESDHFDTLDDALSWMGPMLYTVPVMGRWQRPS